MRVHFLLIVSIFLTCCNSDDSEEVINNCEKIAWYEDMDNDGYGNPDVSLEECIKPEGYVDNNLDCNDNNPELNPDFPTPIWYEDMDNDGYGNPDVSLEECIKPEGFVDNDLDCNDSNPEINPDFPTPIWYEDMDNDGYGNPDVLLEVCIKPEGYVDNNLDCNDINPEINPDAQEIDGNEIDENCDGKYQFPYSVGNKWYYEGSESIVDPWGSSSVSTQYIFESVEKFQEDSKTYYKIKQIKIADGEESVTYSNINPEFDSEIYEYVGTVSLFGYSTKKYDFLFSIYPERITYGYSLKFGQISYSLFNNDEVVHVSKTYSIKGCIINGVSYGDVNLLK
ncbi:putative metal-binding motif-containing protein [Marixanthomonas ophiurae]|uniref:Uncharacterized protein n=1 Tax=Marixanthomonas ophiurae TaxID=387659 RepID=A0A3E1QAL7_9FLAO|nr:putative metal-binding motif-containing protein [Marixanthomonas ophiurae]RFN59166.1 hypothetical protein DZ858_03570 [Marixanthomonas ophiurae]